jgi:hypothetical protein
MRMLQIFSVAVLLMSTNSFAAEVKLTVGGTAFEGGPRFSLYVGQSPIGEAEVPDPITVGGAEFVFEVPDEELRSATEMYIRFLNDRYQEGKGDRNLRILKMDVGSSNVPLSEIQILEGGVVQSRADGALYRSTDVARITIARGRWTTNEQQNEAKIADVPTTAISDCEPERMIIVGYTNGQVALSGEQETRLQSLKGSPGCHATITGYSSTRGYGSANITISQERAHRVWNYIAARGLRFRTHEIEGFGATDKFGPAQADNRRVVIDIH